MPITSFIKIRHGNQYNKLGKVALWLRMKQLSNISPSISRPAVWIKPMLHQLADGWRDEIDGRL